ncbi:carboxymuconolactone decarboxylase family protein [Pseudomonas sp. NPDC007930]|uniref:carboxymuconolactone decarboxylase family protein n=1 Tax=Pseudomonas sp. NPDC007930 TaxID=3364417 RepID=UPI0036E6C19C
MHQWLRICFIPVKHESYAHPLRSAALTRTARVVYLTANFENNCHYCMAGHTTLAKMIDMAPEAIAALRAGSVIPNARLEALHVFTTAVVRDRGFVSDAGIEAFLAAGFTRRNVLEVVLGVATKVMSNYTNHLVHTQLDPFMKGNEWTKPV